MSDDLPPSDRPEGANVPTGSTPKLFGQIDAPRGSGVLGENTAATGTPVGVEGAVPNASDGYGLVTPDDARIEGDLAAASGHTLTVAGRPTFRLDAPASDGRHTAGGNVVAGYHDNGVRTGVVGGVIGGGGSAGDRTVDESGGNRTNANQVTGNYGTIAGGQANRAAGLSFVGSGQVNTASGKKTSVAGGEANVATGRRSSIGGGHAHRTTGDTATVGGGRDNAATGSAPRRRSRTGRRWRDGQPRPHPF